MPTTYNYKLPDGKTASITSDQPLTRDQVVDAIQKELTKGDTISKVLDWLPTIGMGVGGMVGGTAGLAVPGVNLTGASEGAGAMIGAGIGGAGGESLRRAIEAWRGKLADPSLVNATKAEVGAATTGAATEGIGNGVSKAVGAGLKKIAPALYEMGLSRTPTMKENFPNAAQRGVDERIAIPTPGRVQTALTGAEKGVNAAVDNYDQSVLREAVDNPEYAYANKAGARGFLPPKPEVTPLGPAPTPQGGAPGVTRPDSLMVTRGAATPISTEGDRAGLDALLNGRAQLGSTANALPERAFGSGEADVRLANTLGNQTRVATTQPLFPSHAPASPNPTTQYLGTPLGGAIADTVEGAGVRVHAPATTPSARVVPRGMIDPEKIAATALADAKTTAKTAGRWVPSEPNAELESFVTQGLAEHPSAMSAHDALALKRASQMEANYASAEPGKQLANAAHQSVARAAKGELVNAVPSVAGQLNREEDLIGLLDGARRNANGASALRHLIAISSALGTHGATQNPALAGVAAALVEGSRSPYIMGPAGVGTDMIGNALRSRMMSRGFSPNALRAAILATTGAPRESQ